MQEHIQNTLSYMPFLLLVDGKVRVNTARIIEAIIIAAVVGLMTGYVAVGKMEIRLGSIEQKVDKIMEDIYKPIFKERR